MELTLPVEPPPSRWVFDTTAFTRGGPPACPDPRVAPTAAAAPADGSGDGSVGSDGSDRADPELDQGPDDVVGRGADLEAGTLLAAYRAGVFPMPVARRGAPVWWCPARRGVLEPAALVVARSLAKSARRFEVRVDTAFDAVIGACARTSRPGGWITRDLVRAYTRLHALGWAHSVEAWTPAGELAGGLYGVAIGGLFAGESMFHAEGPWARDASKVALAGLVELLTGDDRGGGDHGGGGDRGAGGGRDRLVDVQWLTPHLRSLGAGTVSRRDYLTRLPGLFETPLPRRWR